MNREQNLTLKMSYLKKRSGFERYSKGYEVYLVKEDLLYWQVNLLRWYQKRSISVTHLHREITNQNGEILDLLLGFDMKKPLKI